ncbi:hypothetical protein TRFO_22805 [Tritrichomonas foetus]|uniref:EGF-like domain-containing protein n=1 Tax=Tritrichomonas foetus TaxID=1144522 RepID=A0A1J4KBL8_9EUKA|nr:hypothetical protein TRFO_22805 [Tritrichomonas foetus]|eukprot:OHT08619.1 hypothetical protein TRFO_22805 [Tritrichomonas foetus]
MNTTINSLFLSHVFSAPIMSKSFLSMKNSYISHGFNCFYYNLNRLKLFRSTFSNFLCTPLIYDMENVFNGIYYERPLNQPQSGDLLKIIDSKFINCKSSLNGGAICYISKLDRVLVYQTQFISCFSHKNGGALFFDTKLTKIHYICASNCTADENGQFLYLTVSRYSNISYITHFQAINCKKSSSSGFLCKNGNHDLSHLNISFNTVKKFGAALNAESTFKFVLKFVNIDENKGETILTLFSTTSILQKVKIGYNEAANAIIFFSQQLTIDHSIFIPNSTYIFLPLKGANGLIENSIFASHQSEQQSIVYKNCNFDAIDHQIIPISLNICENNDHINISSESNSETESTIIIRREKSKHDKKRIFDIEMDEENEEENLFNDEIPQKGNTTLSNQDILNDCPGPNTIRVKGKCKCLKKFPFGDPDIESGCWKCNDQCDDNAVCVSPGKCQCKEGFDGDGVNKCDLPLPVIYEISPKNVNKNGNQNIHVFYEINNNFTYRKVFCKIGSAYSVGTLISVKHVLCYLSRITENDSTAFRVSLSFDNETWSKENIFVFLNDGNLSRRYRIQIVGQVWIFFAIIGVILYWTLKNKNKKEEKKMETLDRSEMESFNLQIPLQELEEIDSD